MINSLNPLADIGLIILILVCIVCLIAFGLILSLVMRITHIIREEDTAMKRRLRDDE